ncbi:hypothetical protein ACLE20_04625 [Rhizobium sp. YIM 134829]|uniref:hypothetical protein n=1 Tax=Rhizobium sp. YIM 134829 TaxID=3390453 RepID=UPI003978037A
MSKRKTPTRFTPLLHGPLPITQLEKFGLMLAEGSVAFTIPAQKHALRSHPDSFMSCLPYLAQTVTTPHYVGQSPRHVEAGFELVREVRATGAIVLVAALIKPTRQGTYLVKSTSPIDRFKLENRLRKGHLLSVQ